MPSSRTPPPVWTMYGADFEKFGDNALVQFDENPVNLESTNVETCALCRLIVTIEKAKRLAEVPIYFMQC